MALHSVSDSTFEKEVLGSSTPVLVDFWASWCGPCQYIAPKLEDLAKDVVGKVNIVKLDVDDNPETPTIYQVRGIPILILYKDGKVVGSISGGHHTKSALAEWLTEQLA